jgi:hypothetical protein
MSLAHRRNPECERTIKAACLGRTEQLPRSMRASLLRNLAVKKINSPQLFLVSTSLRNEEWIITRLGIDFEVDRV